MYLHAKTMLGDVKKQLPCRWSVLFPYDGLSLQCIAIQNSCGCAGLETCDNFPGIPASLVVCSSGVHRQPHQSGAVAAIAAQSGSSVCIATAAQRDRSVVCAYSNYMHVCTQRCDHEAMRSLPQVSASLLRVKPISRQQRRYDK